MTITEHPKDSRSFNIPSRRIMTELPSNVHTANVPNNFSDASPVSITEESDTSPGFPYFEDMVALSRVDPCTVGIKTFKNASTPVSMKGIVTSRAGQISKILRQRREELQYKIPIGMLRMNLAGSLKGQNGRRLDLIPTIPNSVAEKESTISRENRTMISSISCQTSDSVNIRDTPERRPARILDVSSVSIKTPLDIQTSKELLGSGANLTQLFRNEYGLMMNDVTGMLERLSTSVTEIEQVMGLLHRDVYDISEFPGTVRMRLCSLKMALSKVISGRRFISRMFEYGAGLYEALAKDQVGKGNGPIRLRLHQKTNRQQQTFSSPIIQTKEIEAKVLPQPIQYFKCADEEEIEIQRNCAIRELFRVRKGLMERIQGQSKQSALQLQSVREELAKRKDKNNAYIAERQDSNAVLLSENDSMYAQIRESEDPVYHSRFLLTKRENGILDFRNKCKSMENGVQVISAHDQSASEHIATLSTKTQMLKQHCRRLPNKSDQFQLVEGEKRCIDDSLATSKKHESTEYVTIPKSRVCSLRKEVRRLSEERKKQNESHSVRMAQDQVEFDVLFDKLCASRHAISNIVQVEQGFGLQEYAPPFEYLLNTYCGP